MTILRKLKNKERDFFAQNKTKEIVFYSWKMYQVNVVFLMNLSLKENSIKKVRKLFNYLISKLSLSD